MDFVKKKAFEAQLNKVGKDLGFGSNVTSGFGSSSQAEPRRSDFSIFPSRNNDDDIEGQGENADASPLSNELATVFETKPKNFPIFVNLFYVDRSILSEAARRPVNTAFYLLCVIESLLVLNTVVNIVFTAVDKGGDWVDLLVGGLVAVLISIFELIAYETAFRGAYRTSTNLRKRYFYFTGANIVMPALYAFLGYTFFHGWSRIPKIPEDAKLKGLRKGLVVVEALFWTGTWFFGMYTSFEFYHFVQGKAQGLSSEAMNNATRSNSNEGPGDHIPPEVGTSRPDRSTRTDNARIQAIKDRYRTAEM